LIVSQTKYSVGDPIIIAAHDVLNEDKKVLIFRPLGYFQHTIRNRARDSPATVCSASGLEYRITAGNVVWDG
jgi:hypothetical protein